jgi:hypothetical protein
MRNYLCADSASVLSACAGSHRNTSFYCHSRHYYDFASRNAQVDLKALAGSKPMLLLHSVVQARPSIVIIRCRNAQNNLSYPLADMLRGLRSARSQPMEEWQMVQHVCK